MEGRLLEKVLVYCCRKPAACVYNSLSPKVSHHSGGSTHDALLPTERGNNESDHETVIYSCCWWSSSSPPFTPYSCSSSSLLLLLHPFLLPLVLLHLLYKLLFLLILAWNSTSFKFTLRWKIHSVLLLLAFFQMSSFL